MHFYKILLVVTVVVPNSFSSNMTDNLISVVVIFRHGDRTIIRPYPTDPYANASYWPEGFGQLVNRGKLRHYELGRYLRSRYDGFLPAVYSVNDIYVRSTDVDRTLMSVEANLAGLYPPTSSQIWNKNISWQPIPIHTTPEHEDALLAMKQPCQKYDYLYKKVMDNEFFRNVSRKNHDLYSYLTRYSGDKITSIESLEYLYSTLFIESLFNYTLPDWAQTVFPDKLFPWAALSFATLTFVPDLARLKTGPLLNEIVEFFKNKTSIKPDTKKILMYSGHDVTIGNVLNSLNIFSYHCPPYASTILFELRQKNGTNYVNIFYKNGTEPQRMTLPGCEFDCNLDQFIKILSPLTLSLNQWQKECNLNLIYYWPLNFNGNVILLSLTGCLLLLTAYFIMVLRRGKKTRDNNYIQLPNEELA